MPLTQIFDHTLIFCIYLGILIGCTIGFYCVGNFVVRIFRINQNTKTFQSFNHLFFSLLTGIIVFSVCISLLFAGIKTIQLGYILLFILGYITARQEKPFLFDTKNLNYQRHFFSSGRLQVGLLFGGTLFYFLLQYYFTVAAYNYPLYKPNADLTFYSTVSEYLLITGHENVFHVFSLIDESFTHLVPYHYLELWLNGGICKLFGLNAFLSLTLIISPIFFLLIFTGLLAVLETLKIPFSWLGLLCMLFPLMDRINLEIFAHLPIIKYADPFNSLLLSVSNNNVSKIGPYYIFLLAALLFAIKRQYRGAILFLLALPVTTITTAPAVLIGLSSTVILLLVFRKVTFKNAGILLVYVLAIAVFIGGFYIFNQSSTPVPQIVQNKSLITILTDFSEFRVRFNLFAGNWIILLFVYFPFIVLYIYYRIKYDETFLKLDLISFAFGNIIFFGLLIWAVLLHMPNSSQLGARIATAVLNLFLFLSTVVIILRSNLNKKRYFTGILLTTLFLVFLLYNGIKFYVKFSAIPPISSQYSNTIIPLLQNKIINKVGGTLIASEDFPKDNVTKNSNYFVIGQYLHLMGNRYRTLSLSDYAIPDETPGDADSLSIYARDGIFYDFVQEQKKAGSFTGLEDSQLAFIKENQLEYLILSPNAILPDKLKPLVLSQWRDNLSKEQFYLLKML